MTTPPWDPASRRGNLLESLSVHSVVIYGLAGWEASGYTCISREVVYPPFGNGCLPERMFTMHYKRLLTLIDSVSSYLSVGLDVGADFTWMSIALPVMK